MVAANKYFEKVKEDGKKVAEGLLKFASAASLFLELLGPVLLAGPFGAKAKLWGWAGKRGIPAIAAAVAGVVTNINEFFDTFNKILGTAEAGDTAPPLAQADKLATAVFDSMGKVLGAFTNFSKVPKVIESFEGLNSTLEKFGTLGSVLKFLTDPVAQFQAITLQPVFDAVKEVLQYRDDFRAKKKEYTEAVQNCVSKVIDYNRCQSNEAAAGDKDCYPPAGSRGVPVGKPGGAPASTGNGVASDPNDIIGPTGFGPQGYLSANRTLPYEIDFENVPSATASAQNVTVTQHLSSGLDYSTFQLGSITFGDHVIQVPVGLTSFTTQVDDTAQNGVLVNISASFDASTGTAKWIFNSIDPKTGDLPNGLNGFLPPDTNPPLGEGAVTYAIQPRGSDTTGTALIAQATVVFDDNAPINTAAILNTIDAGAPASAVSPLPATEPSPSFTVTWSGTDDANGTPGSGIASYNVFVSDNGAPTPCSSRTRPPPLPPSPAWPATPTPSIPSRSTTSATCSPRPRRHRRRRL